MDVVSVDCLTSKTYEDLLEDAVRKLVEIKELKRSRGTKKEGEVQAGGVIAGVLSLKGRLRGEFAKGAEFEVVESPLLDVLLEAMQQSNQRLLVLDNFQNVRLEWDRDLVAQTMEFLSDRAAATGDIKVVAIGIADDAPALLGDSGSFRRRTNEIGVPRMPDDEIELILRNGFEFLELDVEDDAIKQFVFYSDGFPYFAHLLGLQTARSARREGASAARQRISNRHSSGPLVVLSNRFRRGCGAPLRLVERFSLGDGSWGSSPTLLCVNGAAPMSSPSLKTDSSRGTTGRSSTSLSPS